MTAFNKQLSYRFTAFIAPVMPLPQPDVFKAFVSGLSAQPSAGKNFGLKFSGAPEHAVGLVGLTGSTQQIQTDVLKWRSPSGHWHLTATSLRVDLQFEALGYQEALEEDSVISPETVWGRVKSGFVNIGKIGRRVSRLAYFVDGVQEMSFDEAGRTVFDRFFRPEIAEDGSVRDAHARLNLRDEWILPTGKVAINRIETLASEQDGCRWQWDVNTAMEEERIFSPEDIEAFMGQAMAWVSPRMGSS